MHGLTLDPESSPFSLKMACQGSCLASPGGYPVETDADVLPLGHINAYVSETGPDQPSLTGSTNT